MRNSVFTKGFTIVELLVALVVTSILLAAISTLAFALSSAKEATEDISRSQTEVRFATLKIQELIRNCNLICSVSDDDIAVWFSDNNNDNKINIGELMFIERGTERNHLRLYTFPSENDSEIALDSIEAVSTNWWSEYSNNVEYVSLLPECRNVDFRFDASPPYSRFLSISFEMRENELVRQYRIDVSVRGGRINLLDESGNIVSDDD